VLAHELREREDVLAAALERLPLTAGRPGLPVDKPLDPDRLDREAADRRVLVDLQCRDRLVVDARQNNAADVRQQKLIRAMQCRFFESFRRFGKFAKLL
jgi:hypothetical protein